MTKLKTKEELLNSFNKASNERKEKMANNAGFNSVSEFKEHLEKQVAFDKVNEKEEVLVIHNVHILDASGSMTWGNKFLFAKEGITAEVIKLNESKQKGVDYVHSLVTFSDPNKYKVNYWREVNPTFPENVFHGNTALYDAIGKTLTKLLSESKADGEKTIVKIFTDGEENQSFEYSSLAVSNLIKEAEKNNIAVTFVGTDTDVSNVIKRLNIHETNTLVHDNTSMGVMKSFEVSAVNTVSYATRAMAGEDVLTGFYKKEGTL